VIDRGVSVIDKSAREKKTSQYFLQYYHAQIIQNSNRNNRINEPDKNALRESRNEVDRI